MSGDFFYSGILADNAATLAVQEFTEQYGRIGGREVQLILKNTQSDAKIATAEVRELIEKDEVLAIIGPTRSPVAIAIDGYVQKSQTPMITTQQRTRSLRKSATISFV